MKLRGWMLNINRVGVSVGNSNVSGRKTGQTKTETTTLIKSMCPLTWRYLNKRTIILD